MTGAQRPRRSLADRLWTLHRWLYPGMRVKRWVGLGLIGLAVLLLGAALMRPAQSLDALSAPNRALRWIGRTLHHPIEGGPLQRRLGLIPVFGGAGLGLHAF